MKKNRYVGIFSVLLFCMVFLLAACSDVGGQSTIGGKAPDFTLKTVAGKTINLADTLKTKPAVLVFWATWCPACVGEIPDVEKFYQSKGDEVAVIAINIQESEKVVAHFVSKKGMSYPVALDTTGKIAQSYGVRGIPSVIAVDKSGDILYYGHDIVEMSGRVNFKKRI
jgi:peroxiredoxin